MMKQVALGSLLAALAMFVWGFLFWALLPASVTGISTAADETLLAAHLQEVLPEGGTYTLPAPGMTTEASMEIYESGPLAMIFYHPGGAPSMGLTLVLGYLHMVLTAFLIALLLRGASGHLDRGKQIALVALAGLAVAVWSHLGDPIWYHQPWGFNIASAVYDVVAWTLAGVVLVRFVRPDGLT